MSPLIADTRDGERLVCILKVAGVLNAGEPGAFACQGGRAGTGVTQSNISRINNGNRMHLSSISSLIAKGLNTYVKKVFLFLFIIHLQTFLKNYFGGFVWRLKR